MATCKPDTENCELDTANCWAVKKHSKIMCHSPFNEFQGLLDPGFIFIRNKYKENTNNFTRPQCRDQGYGAPPGSNTPTTIMANLQNLNYNNIIV